MLAERQSFLVTLLLVLLAIRFSFADSLPKFPYLTTLDWKIFLSWGGLTIIFVVLSLPNASNYEDIIFITWISISSFIEIISIFLGWKRIQLQRNELAKRAKFYFEEKDIPSKIEINSIDGKIPEPDDLKKNK